MENPLIVHRQNGPFIQKKTRHHFSDGGPNLLFYSCSAKHKKLRTRHHFGGNNSNSRNNRS
jgi:hypothetical protein